MTAIHPEVTPLARDKGKGGGGAPHRSASGRGAARSLDPIELEALREQRKIALAHIGLHKWIWGVVCIPVSIAALALPAWVLAGRTTIVSVNMAITFAATVTIGWALTGVALHRKRKHVTRVVNRNKELEAALESAITARATAEKDHQEMAAKLAAALAERDEAIIKRVAAEAARDAVEATCREAEKRAANLVVDLVTVRSELDHSRALSSGTFDSMAGGSREAAG